MEGTSHREHRTHVRWLREQWNKPNRSDKYLMRVAQRVQQVLAKNSNNITIEQQEIEFEFKQVHVLTKEEQRKIKTKEQKSAWKSFAGGLSAVWKDIGGGKSTVVRKPKK